MNPGIAVLLGFLFGNETAAAYMYIGFPLILTGLATMLYGETLLGSLRIGGERKSEIR